MSITEALVAAVPEGPGRAWLVEQVGRAAFAPAFAAAGRKLGRAEISAGAAAAICAAGLRWPVTGADECGRAALVLGAIDGVPDPVGFVRDLVRRGELGERQAVLRVLAALPAPARFVDVAIDACRSNVATVFAAIACDNDYPARELPAPAFHQLVIKALFTGAPVARIAGLAARVDDELIRMVDAFISERRAAGRSIPDDVALIRR